MKGISKKRWCVCVYVFHMLFLPPVTPAEPIRVLTRDRWPTQNSLTQGGSTCRGPFTKVWVQRKHRGFVPAASYP